MEELPHGIETELLHPIAAKDDAKWQQMKVMHLNLKAHEP